MPYVENIEYIYKELHSVMNTHYIGYVFETRVWCYMTDCLKLVSPITSPNENMYFVMLCYFVAQMHMF